MSPDFDNYLRIADEYLARTILFFYNPRIYNKQVGYNYGTAHTCSHLTEEFLPLCQAQIKHPAQSRNNLSLRRSAAMTGS